MKIIFSTTLIIAIFFSNSTLAKNRINNNIASIRPWEIGLSSGLSIYGTSMNPESNPKYKRNCYWNREVNPGFGLFMVKNISPSLGIEINWFNTNLTGTWKNRLKPFPILVGHESPLKFNSQINQFDLTIVFNVDQIMLPGDNEDRGHLFIKTGIGISAIKDNEKFYPDVTTTEISYVLGGGYSVSLNEKIKLQIGNSLRAVNTDNLDGVHVLSHDKNGKIVELMKIFEIYNYTYLSVSYSFGNFGSKKHKNMIKNRR